SFAAISPSLPLRHPAAIPGHLPITVAASQRVVIAATYACAAAGGSPDVDAFVAKHKAAVAGDRRLSAAARDRRGSDLDHLPGRAGIAWPPGGAQGHARGRAARRSEPAQVRERDPYHRPAGPSAYRRHPPPGPDGGRPALLLDALPVTRAPGPARLPRRRGRSAPGAAGPAVGAGLCARARGDPPRRQGRERAVR